MVIRKLFRRAPPPPPAPTPWPTASNPCPTPDTVGHTSAVYWGVRGTTTKLCIGCVYDREQMIGERQGLTRDRFHLFPAAVREAALQTFVPDETLQ